MDLDSFNPTFPDLAQIEVNRLQYADHQYELIVDSIYEFEKSLDDDHEVALLLASFGQSVLMNVTGISYANPSLIYFYGYVNGRQSTLIQHISQLNFLLTSVEKSDPEKPARRIGFDTSGQ